MMQYIKLNIFGSFINKNGYKNTNVPTDSTYKRLVLNRPRWQLALVRKIDMNLPSF